MGHCGSLPGNSCSGCGCGCGCECSSERSGHDTKRSQSRPTAPLDDTFTLTPAPVKSSWQRWQKAKKQRKTLQSDFNFPRTHPGDRLHSGPVAAGREQRRLIDTVRAHEGRRMLHVQTEVIQPPPPPPTPSLTSLIRQLTAIWRRLELNLEEYSKKNCDAASTCWLSYWNPRGGV